MTFSAVLSTCLFYLSLWATATAAPIAVRQSQAQEQGPYPTLPLSDTVYVSGDACVINWNGFGSEIWKAPMTIQLMTGPNLQMVPLLNVTDSADGSVNGTFTHTCPPVNMSAPVYFYQFSTPKTTMPNWTTRFTIKIDNSTEPVAAPYNDSGVMWGYGGIENTTLTNSSASTSPKDSKQSHHHGHRHHNDTEN